MTPENQDPWQDHLFVIPKDVAELPYNPGIDVQASHIEAPLSMADLLSARELARAAFTAGAYEELGGGIKEAKFNAGDVNYGKFLDNFDNEKPWKAEVISAFEQFNLTKLEPSVLRKMTKEDKRVLAHYFTHYVDHLWKRSGVLMAPGSAGSEVADRYGFQDDAVAELYGKELKELHDILKQNPIYPLLSNISLDDRPVYRRAAFIERYTTQHGKPSLVLDTHSQKYRFQPVVD